MEGEKPPSNMPSIVKGVVIATIVIFIAVAVIVWVLGWATVYQYGTGLIVGGIIAMVFGLFSVAGGMRSTRSFTYQQAESAGYQDGHDRAVEAKQNLAETFAFLIILGLAGAIAIAAGLVLRAVAG